MRTAKVWVIAAAILGLVGAIDPGVAGAAATRSANTYLYRSFPSGHNYTQAYSVVDPEGVHEIWPGTPAGRFFAYSFFFTGVDTSKQGYIGLQSRLLTNGANTGYGAIFSIFGATGASANGGQGTVQSGVELGQTYYSLHWAFPVAFFHDYTTVVTRVDGTHYDGHLFDGTSWWYIGRITVPSGWGYFSSSSPATHVQWTEAYYPTSWNSCSYISQSSVVFKRPYMVEGANVYYSNSASTYIPDDGGATYCTAASSITNLDGTSYRETVGTF